MIDIKKVDQFIKYLNESMSEQTISHCNKCHHEAYTILGQKCSWCGGAMIEEKKK